MCDFSLSFFQAFQPCQLYNDRGVCVGEEDDVHAHERRLYAALHCREGTSSGTGAALLTSGVTSGTQEDKQCA